MTILFVCSGNIHRSALAEAMLRGQALRDGRSDLRAASAGVIAVRGMEAVPEAVALAEQSGLDLSNHRSRPVTEELQAGADVIVVAERFHLEWMGERHPDALGRCTLLSEYAGAVSGAEGVAPGDDVPDAIGGDLDSFRRSFAIILDCVRGLYRELPAAPQEIYFRAIEERFRSRRHTLLTLSPADFGLMERWWDRGIPLWIVLETIDDRFGRKDAAGEPSRVRSLGFIRSDVEERFEGYERARAGRGMPVAGAAGPHADGDALLREAAARLREAADGARLRGLEEAAVVFHRVASTLALGAEQVARDGAEARLRLHDLDGELMSRLRDLASGEELRCLRDRAASQLAEHRERMTPAAFEATVSRLVEEHIRIRYGVPDLMQI